MTEPETVAIPLTQSQGLIWTGQSLAPEAPLYNMVWRIGLRGALDPDRFAAAWAQVVTGADMLRARFETLQGQPVQTVAGAGPALQVLDLSGEADPQRAADDWIATDAAIPVDLTQSTWRSRLLKLGDSDWIWYLNQHHIATDGAAGAVLLRRMGAAYARTDLPSPPQFADHARALAGAAPPDPAIRAFWEAQAEGHRPMTPPYGATRQPGLPASQRLRLDFGADRSARLRACLANPRFAAISRDLGAFALWAALYAGWLHRITGDTVIRIGAPFHNRLTPAQQDTVGLFIEMLPLTVGVQAGDTLETLFDRCLSAAIDYLRHARPGAGTPETVALFNAVLNFMPVQIPPLAGLETDVQWLQAGAHDGAHDLRLHVYDFNATGTFTVEMDVNAALLSAPAGEAAAAQFLSLIDAALEGPSRPLNQLALTDNRDSILTGPDSPATPASVLDPIATHAGSAAPAVICGDASLSHAELASLSDRFASALVALGVSPDRPVAICARRSLRLPAAVLGVLKAGGCFVPLATDTPPDRVAAILNRLKPAAIIADAAGRALLPSDTAPLLALEADLPEGTTAPGPGSLAYVIFTSGSTGTPKGVEVAHDAFARYIDWVARSHGPQGPTDMPLCSALGFDLTLTALFVPLVTGGAIHVYPETPGGTDLAILDVFAQDAVDVVKLTPAHLALAVAQGSPVRRISTLILGGENLTTALCRKARARLGAHLTLANEYGPTEAVVGCMLHRFNPATDTGANVPIGQPADGMTIAILDKGGNPVPAGVVGEIHIGGNRLARGYYHDPDQTAAVFRPDPFGTGPKLYASGDLARLCPDGTVNYLGRADQQLKLSGVRIEPAEVEAALLSHDAVSAAHVLAWTPGTGKAARCTRCGLSDTVPNVTLDVEGICDICRAFEGIRDAAQAYFDTPEGLQAELARARARKTGKHDAIMLLSGGKDSAYALYRLADLTRDVLVLTLDNGFLSEGAKDNIRRMTADLGLEHRFLTTPAMNEIFRDSLQRFSNVCQGCFKTIYALALKVARDEGIPAIVTGLSRGQFFETRLTPDLFRGRTPSRAEIEAVVLRARKAYHGMDDSVARLLGTHEFLDEEVLEEIRFIDLYRYIDVPVSEIYRFLDTHAPWVRPGDTGRSTNCLINDLGIHVHSRREGYHNYALPYAWDVRLGHKTRDEALRELDDDIDPAKAEALLAQIGLEARALPPRRSGLVAYVAGDVDPAELRAHLAARLPREMMPRHLVRLSALPLTANGKVDRAALPRPDPVLSTPDSAREPAETATERALLEIYQRILGREDFGVTDNFYDIGGESIAAIQIALAAGEAGLAVGSTAVFEHQTIRTLAQAVDGATPVQPAPKVTKSRAPLIDLGAEDMAALGRVRARKARADSP